VVDLVADAFAFLFDDNTEETFLLLLRADNIFLDQVPHLAIVGLVEQVCAHPICLLQRLVINGKLPNAFFRLIQILNKFVGALLLLRKEPPDMASEYNSAHGLRDAEQLEAAAVVEVF
jgi:hypothetical protein